MKYLLELAIVVGVASSCSEKQSKPLSESSVAASGEVALPSDMLRYLPSDTSMVFGVRVAGLLDSSFGKTIWLENDKKGRMYRSDLKEKCGIDLLTVAKDLIIVPGRGRDFLNRKELVFGLQSSLDQKAFEECVVSMEGTVEDGMYSGKKQSFHAYWPAPGIAFFSTEKTSKELQSWAAEGNGLGNETLLSLIGEIDNKASIWAAGVIPEPVLEVLTDLDQSPLSGHLGVIFDKDVHVLSA
ncbi:MAG: hypothetical protein JKY56_12405 [Kofleriaceae bacterium]|nr:hypothetical protein [Kofleriaceae bacterium]